MRDDKIIFEIGDKIQGCTQVPTYYDKDGICFVDCPGFMD